MAVSVVMPALEMAQESGKLVSWLKKEGEQVRKGEMLLEVETDKAVVEVEAASDGILAGITARPGDVVPVGRTIAWLVQPGEAAPASSPADVPAGRRADSLTAPHVARVLSDPASVFSDPASVPSDQSAGAESPVAPRISPKARRLAREHGIDISRLKGSGPGSEILAEDILAAAQQVRPKPDTTPARSGLQSYGASGMSRTVARTGVGADAAPPEPLSTVGRLMAERTTESWTTIPHFFVTREIDAAALNAAREAMLPAIERSHGVKLTHTDLIVAAVARVLRRHPRLNASWTADGIVLRQQVNIALALAVTDAVVIGVIPKADATAIADIALRRRDLAERARAGRLQPDDIAEPTFTISNLGMYGVDAFTAIIVPPQAAVLAVGAILDQVVAAGGQPAVRPMMTMTVSCDHRVVDGARAAEFLRDVAEALRDPVRT